MFKKVKDFLRSESGYTTEALVYSAVLGVGAATVAFGLYGANRFQGGGIVDDMKAINTPSSLPVATESVAGLDAGYTGVITGMTIE